MEGLIEFLEQYWGVTIVGGITIGTIATFILVQIRAFIRDKLKSAEIERLITFITKVKDDMNALEQSQSDTVAQNQYLQQVISTVFQTLAYLTIASKLPTEDKIVLQAKYAALAEEGNALFAASVAPTLPNTTIAPVAAVVESAAEVVQAVVAGTTNLLSKYTGAQ